MATRIHKSSGNVFRDVGFPPEEAAHLLIRADLMIEVGRVLKERGLTQVQAAKVLGITQPRVSNLVRGRVTLFTIDTLVEFLARLGITITVRLRKARRVA